ncbi:MAG: hypothetical protein NC202_13150, partial [Roseburia sp.]|nr:hypothetical protein [Roseburia sp.]
RPALRGRGRALGDGRRSAGGIRRRRGGDGHGNGRNAVRADECQRRGRLYCLGRSSGGLWVYRKSL